MKKIALILILSTVLLCSCEFPASDNPTRNTDNLDIKIYVDGETGVNYYTFHEGYAGGMTIRLNADGTPYVSKENNQ